MPLFYLLLVCVTILTVSTLYDKYYTPAQSQREIDFLIDSFAPIKNEKLDNDAMTSTATDSDPDPIPPTLDVLTNTDPLGIMTIERLNIKAPIGYGLSESTLLKQIGTYKTIENFAQKGKNAGFAAHSASFEGCDYCYFNAIDLLEEGDEIKIDWLDGNTYTYRVFKKYLHAAPDALYAYEVYADRSLITLVTCSDGIADNRDFIQAELVSLKEN